jgi:hypothetical protein
MPNLEANNLLSKAGQQGKLEFFLPSSYMCQMPGLLSRRPATVKKDHGSSGKRMLDCGKGAW